MPFATCPSEPPLAQLHTHSMKRITLTLMLATTLFAGFGAPGRTDTSMSSMSATSSRPSTKVAIDNYAYKAPTITVATRTTVIWTNLDDDPHTVTADDGSFNSKGMAQSDTWSHLFTKPGKYSYHCTVHPFMRGTVIVKESGS